MWVKRCGVKNFDSPLDGITWIIITLYRRQALKEIHAYAATIKKLSGGFLRNLL